MIKFLILMTISTSAFAFFPDESNTKIREKCDYICQHPGLREKLDSYEEQKRIMQGHINDAVGRQNEVDKIIRQNEGKLNHIEMCKAVSVYESMDYNGDINPVKYSEVYGKCLRKQ